VVGRGLQTLPAYQRTVGSLRHRALPHGWDLEPVLAQARGAAHAERVVGLWALGSLIQTWIGAQVVQGPPAVQAVATHSTTTGRLSVWAHAQLALHEPSGALRPWLIRTLHQGARRRAPSGTDAPARHVPRLQRKAA
jgi:hypothetical protein